MLNKKEIHVLDRLFRVRKRDLPYLHIIFMIIKGIVVKIIHKKDLCLKDSSLSNALISFFAKNESIIERSKMINTVKSRIILR
jgi:hypothetical protein